MDAQSSSTDHRRKYSVLVLLLLALMGLTYPLPKTVSVPMLIVFIIIYHFTWNCINKGHSIRRLRGEYRDTSQDSQRSDPERSDSGTAGNTISLNKITSEVPGTATSLVGACAVGMSQHLKDRLDRSEAGLRANLSLPGLVPLLLTRAGGFMCDEEKSNALRHIYTDGEKVSAIIRTLKTKTDNDYFRFCDILDQSNNGHLATSLRGKTIGQYVPVRIHRPLQLRMKYCMDSMDDRVMDCMDSMDYGSHSNTFLLKWSFAFFIFMVLIYWCM